MSDLFLLEEFIRETLSEKAKYPSQYKATGKRKKILDKATELAKSEDPAEKARGIQMRNDQEDEARKTMEKS